jgi:hypothetical protein
LERLVVQALSSPNGAALDPGVADQLARRAAETSDRQEERGVPACLPVPPAASKGTEMEVLVLLSVGEGRW